MALLIPHELQISPYCLLGMAPIQLAGGPGAR